MSPTKTAGSVLLGARVSRSKFLAGLGSSLFAVADSVVRSPRAWAVHEPVQSPCAGIDGKCDCCSGSVCCGQSCTPEAGYCKAGNPSVNKNCWWICSSSSTYLYKCCDYKTGRGNICTCRSKIKKEPCVQCPEALMSLPAVPVPTDVDHPLPTIC